VEDGQVWQALSMLGCDHAQGYFLSRPLTSTQLSRWLRDRRTEQRDLDGLLSGIDLTLKPIAE
jgi:sensor c-di-GMP phosphodiesterase-like protein